MHRHPPFGRELVVSGQHRHAIHTDRLRERSRPGQAVAGTEPSPRDVVDDSLCDLREECPISEALEMQVEIPHIQSRRILTHSSLRVWPSEYPVQPPAAGLTAERGAPLPRGLATAPGPAFCGPLCARRWQPAGAPASRARATSRDAPKDRSEERRV